MSLTKRQKAILKAIVSEFMENAESVGSVTLSDKYELGVSPATLRSEMIKLTQEGYLFKRHSSSGRIPTTIGIRYFLNELLKAEELEQIRETRVKEQLFQKRFDKIGFIKEAVKVLSNLTHQATVSVVNDTLFLSGLSHLLSYHEFEDRKILENTLNIIESEQTLLALFRKFVRNRHLSIVIGDEIGINSLSDCSIVYSPFNFFRGETGYIGIIGPTSMKYTKNIPAVQNISQFIEDAIIGWE